MDRKGKKKINASHLIAGFGGKKERESKISSSCLNMRGLVLIEMRTKGDGGAC